METQEIHSHMKAVPSSPLLTKTMMNGRRTTALKYSKVVGGTACVIWPVLMVCTSLDATQTQRILPRESRGIAGLGTNTF